MSTSEKARQGLKEKYGVAKSITLIVDYQAEIEFYRVDKQGKPRVKMLVTFTGSNETLVYSLNLEDIIKGESI